MEHILWTLGMMDLRIRWKNIESLMMVMVTMKEALPQEFQGRSFHAARRKWFPIVGGPAGYFELSGTIQIDGPSRKVPYWIGMDYFLVAIGFYVRSVQSTEKTMYNKRRSDPVRLPSTHVFIDTNTNVFPRCFRCQLYNPRTHHLQCITFSKYLKYSLLSPPSFEDVHEDIEHPTVIG